AQGEAGRRLVGARMSKFAGSHGESYKFCKRWPSSRQRGSWAARSAIPSELLLVVGKALPDVIVHRCAGSLEAQQHGADDRGELRLLQEIPLSAAAGCGQPASQLPVH